jgi:polysaccharide biosynthesis protein PslJ
MRVIAGSAERGPLVSSAVVLASLAMLSLVVVRGMPISGVAPLFLLIVAVAVWHRTLFQWQSLLYLLLLVILFIPIQRYKLPAGLPFDLEPYRLVVAFILVGWLLSLLVDPRVRVRRSGLEGPFLLIAGASLGSVVVNAGHVAGLQADVVKTMTFMASFVLLFYLIVAVVRSKRSVDALIKLLVVGGVVIAAFAVVEARSGYNPFSHLAGWVPFLNPETSFLGERERFGAIRAYGPAQHPIALGAAIVMLIPLALYLAATTRRLGWWLATLLLTIGAVATMSRTSIVMLGVVGLVFLWLRPKQTKRFWPALLPAVVAIHFVMPGTLGTVQEMFVPKGGLIQDQRASAGSRSSSGRVADLGPAFEELSRQPLLGQGMGTRITAGPRANAALLDNQWLKTLLETGILGAAGWIWLVGRFIRRAGREAKHDLTDRGWCLAAIVVSVAAFAVGMLFYDAFSFIQVTFVFFILLALGVVVRSSAASDRPRRAYG